MKLENLLKTLEYELVSGTLEHEITEVEQHSGRIVPGTFFVAISGFTRDGHEFVKDVIAAGAVAVAIERDIDIRELGNEVAIIKVADTKQFLALVANCFYGEPSKALNVIGVTGTNGKTSITQILNNLYQAVGERNAVLGTIANYIEDEVVPTNNTTPDALELARLTKRAVDKNVQNLFMEVSSHALKLDRAYGMQFDYAIFTNLTEDHMDFHPDFEDYFNAKLKLFKMAQKGCVINQDNEYGRRILKVTRDKPTIAYGLTSDADLWADELRYEQSGTFAKLHYKGKEATVFIGIPGKIYVYNVLACLGVMLLEGRDFDATISLVSAIKPVRGRLELVSNPANQTVLLDYAHTPDALENVLKAIHEFAKGRIITVFGCGGDRDRKKRPMMGAVAQKHSDLVILTSDNPRTEDPAEIIKDVLGGMLHTPELFVESDRRSGIYKALSLAQENDVILIAGKGHENYQIIGKIKIHFDDKEVVEDYYSKGQSYRG